MTRFFCLLSLIFPALLSAQHPGNATLALPLEAPGGDYRIVEAFAGLDFGDPIAIGAPPGEVNRLFVARRFGQVVVIPDLENPSMEAFLDISEQVGSTSSERGLLGMAFHPDYDENGFLFLFYTTNTDGPLGPGWYNRLSRFRVSAGDPLPGRAHRRPLVLGRRIGGVFPRRSERVSRGPTSCLLQSSRLP